MTANTRSLAFLAVTEMAQTFRTLAIFLTIAILATIALGFWSFFTPGADKDEFVAHFVIGLTTVLGILLVHCLIFIYFLGPAAGSRK